MTTKRDYYETLGVNRNANEEDIRKAFRKKAMEFHPDRNKETGADEKFKEVNEAYQILSDPERRSRYDQFGHAGVNSSSGFSGQGFDGFDAFGGFGDIFDAFFGGGSSQRSRARTGRTLQTNISLTFEEAAFGVTKEIEIARVEKCSACAGSRSEPGTKSESCSNCQGSGKVRRTQRSVFGQFVTEAVCNTCTGTGEKIVSPCKSCRGRGRENKSHKIKIPIPAGVFEGANLSLEGQGDAGEFGGPAGDLLVNIKIQQHGLFKRSENNVLSNIKIDFPDAALGTSIEIPTLDGPEQVKIPAGTQSGETIRLKSKGIPHLNRNGRRGDHIVNIHVSTPGKLSKEQRELLEKLQQSMRES